MLLLLLEPILRAVFLSSIHLRAALLRRLWIRTFDQTWATVYFLVCLSVPLMCFEVPAALSIWLTSDVEDKGSDTVWMLSPGVKRNLYCLVAQFHLYDWYQELIIASYEFQIRYSLYFQTREFFKPAFRWINTALASCELSQGSTLTRTVITAVALHRVVD